MGSRVHSNPFDNLGGCECNLCHQGKSRRSELCPPNSVWEIGVSGLPRLLSLPQTCECGYCESGDGSSDALLNTASPFSTGILGRKELASAQCSCESTTDRPAIQSSSGADRVASTLREKASYLRKHMRIHAQAHTPAQKGETDSMGLFVVRICFHGLSLESWGKNQLIEGLRLEEPLGLQANAVASQEMGWGLAEEHTEEGTRQGPSICYLRAGMADLESAFRKYAVFGDTSASGNDMTSKNFSKMMKECGVMDGKLVTSTDVDILFSKVKTKGARNITYPEFQEALKELSVKRFKGKSPEEALQATHKLIAGKEPCLIGATKSVTAGAVDRLTDTSKYTGSHKERFDDSGKGKGIAGRADLAQNTGYVGAYKGAGTYDKSH
ncbi:hypothetical protein JRQ81_005592 [Phrynocephalus forsythii]|uniref:Tubulin polymerization-promoting protein family member 2 n=1 Tax=Phrynocephalus forsythii TaxID=171643 RepID=A0A9Q1AVI6_9SAUR|nr:hypothetical protein JRQ81_005592 [Phrynocephalus forsythii]